MTHSNRTPQTIEQRLLDEPCLTAGLDSEREPIRLGERDSSGQLAGYIDPGGLAWESLTEQLVATHGGQLAEALRLPAGHPRREQLLNDVLADVPDELIGPVAQQAAGLLGLRSLAGEAPLAP
jgi:hypothetical protein